MNVSISLKEALEIIDKKDSQGNSIPFDISFRSLQRNSKTGGKLYEYIQVKKLVSDPKEPTNASLLKAVQSPETIEKNPNHFKNRTRNLVLQNGDIKKIHIRLIITVNRKKVVY